MLRIAFFGSGSPFSAKVLEAVARIHKVVAIVGATPRGIGFTSRARGLARGVANRVVRRRGILERAAVDLGVAHVRMANRADQRAIAHLRRLGPDVACIAAFPWILPSEVLAIPRLGSLNVHTSLLPRHRGPMPLFWMYIHDDREAGVTVHWVDEHADAGDIVAQDAIPIGRGESIVLVHERCSERAAAMLPEALDAIERGDSPRRPQEERLASREPAFRPGSRFIDYEWDVERVWHVLSGLRPLFREPLADGAGKGISYGAVLGYERRDHRERVGSLIVTDEGYALFCRDGLVRLGLDAGRT